MDYATFLARKAKVVHDSGHNPTALPSQLFPWQAAIVKWAVRKGRAAIFADCGLGKTFMQLAWAQAIGQRTLFLAPLCVAEQTVQEAAKLGMELHYATDDRTAAQQPYVITNYERLDKFALSAFGAVVLDESSILKAFYGKTRSALIAAFQHTRYRLCCTATPSPNDIAELANHAEFLGLQTRAEFLASWFVHDDQGWRMKGHAVTPFFRWMASWACAVRAPSDLGYPDDGFALPTLTITDELVATDATHTGSLFPELGTKGLSGRLAARRSSLTDRVEATVRLVQESGTDQWLIWCGLNEEADALAEAIPNALNVAGNDTYAEKVGAVSSFLSGETRSLVSKIRILGFGMNFQHCHRMAFVGMGDSYEQYYQGIRRCWRFGQRSPVDVRVVVSEAEQVIVQNVRRKERASRALSDQLVAQMRDYEQEEVAV